MATRFSAEHASVVLDDAHAVRRVTPPFDLVFLTDVDNTLLGNDAVERDPRRHTEAAFGREYHERFWQTFEQQLAELGYADYLGARCRGLRRAGDRRKPDPRTGR